MTLTPGTRLGPYEIIAPLGAGGMGEVWKARDTRLDRVVAIKCCRHEFSNRFLREARAVASLNHPNICTLHDVGPDYLVMEYIEGVPPRGPLSPSDAVRLALGIAAALEAAHARGITHRDLKPANILVTEAGVKLLDFGLALVDDNAGGGISNAATALTAAGAVVGTVAYMSPEQAQGQPVDARSDIFSFGLVLYELLSGRRAFAGSSAIDTMAAIIRDEPVPLGAPARLSAVVTRCLRKAPVSRFQTMSEVRTALEQAALEDETAGRADAAPSIAVLPFANLSADKENEYFSDGLAEEILNLLARIPGLKVIARTSSFAFRGKEQDITTIAEALRVQHILEGSVRKAGNRIRITAQLIAAADGAHLWSERYDRDMTDVFAIQDEIGQAISEALEVRLAPRAHTMNIEAYQHHLKGRYHLLRLSLESMAKGKACFEQALAIDPNYAPAHSALAEYFHTLLILGIEPVADMAPLARSAAEKALAIDPAHSEAHSILASMAASVDYQWNVADTHHRKAMAIELVPSIVRFRYATWYLLPLGRVADAVEQNRLGLETDPLSMPLHYGMALCKYQAKQYQETIEYARRALEIDANLYVIWLAMGHAQLCAGVAQDAIASLTRVVELVPWWHMGVGSLAAACHASGDHERSQEWSRRLTERHGRTYGAAIYYAVTGGVDAMFDALDGAHRQRDVFLPHIQGMSFFDPYRADPRFQTLLANMNLA